MIYHRYIVTLHCDGLALRYAIVVEGDDGPIAAARADLASRIDAPTDVISNATVVECVETGIGLCTRGAHIELLHITGI